MTLGKFLKLPVPHYPYLFRENKYPPAGLKEIMCVLDHESQTCLPALTFYEMETSDWF